MGHLDDALDDLCARWGPRFGAPLPAVARATARELLLVALTGCAPGQELSTSAAALGVLRAHEGHDAAAVVEDLYALRPLVGGGLADALEVAVRAAVGAHCLERARPLMPTRDRLTGLLDRPVFEESLAHEVHGAARHGAPALVVADLDGLVAFSEQHGHLAGDLHLVRMADVLTGCARRSDVLTRLTTDQVAVLLPRTDLSRSLVVARRVLARAQSDAKTAELATPGSTTDLPRLSVGVGWVAEPTSAADVLASAEQALQRARTLGGWVVETAA